MPVVVFGLALSAFTAGCSVDVDDEPDCLGTCEATHLDCQGACSDDRCRATCDLHGGQCEGTCEGTRDGGTSASPPAAAAHDLAVAAAHDAAVDCRTPCEEQHTGCTGPCSRRCSIKCAGASVLLICFAGCRDTECALDCDSSCIADCTSSCEGNCNIQEETCTRACT